MDQIDGGGAVAGDVHRVAGAFQAARQEVLNPFFVFDDEDSHKGRRYLPLLNHHYLLSNRDRWLAA